MTTLFPGALDQFANPTPSTSQNAAVTHSGQHGNLNDAVEALEAKVGANGSAVASSLDYKVSQFALSGGSAGVGFLQAGTGAVPRTMQARLRDTVSAMDFGATGNGVADDTSALALAVTYAAASNRRILLPSGVYRLTAPLVIPSGVSLIGEGAQAYTAPNNTAALPGNGTWLHFDHPGIGINVVGPNAASASCTISSLGTRRTHATPGVGWVPTVYDYDFVVEGVETFLDDVLLLNAYKGVVIRSSGYGRLWTNRLRGQCFAEGVHLQQSYDTCRLRDTHFWPYWSQQANVIAWQNANTKNFRIARADGAMISGVWAIYSAVGCEIYGTGDGTAYGLRMSDCCFDHTNLGISVLASSDDASVYLSNVGVFGATGSTTSKGIQITGTNGRYSLSNTDLSLLGRDGIRVDGTGNTIKSFGTRVRYFNQAAVGAAAYEVAATNRLEFADRPYAIQGGAGTMFNAVTGVVEADLGSGIFSGSTDASGDVVVTHGCGTTPRISIEGVGLGTNRVSLSSETATQFTVRMFNPAGTAVASTTCNFNWSARKY